MEQYIRQATADDVKFLADNLRVEDVEEVEAIGVSPLYALSHGLETSQICWTLLDPSQTPIAMVGVGPSHNPQLGAIWLLGTRGIETNTYRFLKYSREALERLFEATSYEGMYNYSYAGNHLHHRWLKWLGFVFLQEALLPPNSKPFLEFVKLRG